MPDDRVATRRDWLKEPKSAVWMALAAIVLIGGGRRMLWAWRARKAVSRLSDPAVTPEQIEAVAGYGRSGAWELLRLVSTSESEPMRRAAARGLARLWRNEELVAEEEQALVRRGFTATWIARRRYPRSLKAPIPIAVAYDIAFLPHEPGYVRGTDLEWSYRIIGARRAALEEFSPWRAGPGELSFSIVPDDFPTNGPHRLVLQAKVRTAGLSDAWEIELPHVAFQFDFDPVLRLEAILALPDAGRGEAISRSVRLEPASVSDRESPRHVPLGGEWVLRNPPRLAIESPLPSDLAHQVSIEFEGAPGRFPAGTLVLGGQGLAHRAGTPAVPEIRRFDVEAISGVPDGLIERPGTRRLRVHLTADPQLGWAHPDVRSVWPGEVETNWCEVAILRR